MTCNDAPAVTPFLSYVDVRIRREHLDLEREYIMRYCRHEAAVYWTANAIVDIKPVQRFYLLGENPPDMNRILRHLVNPVIHEWEVVYA